MAPTSAANDEHEYGVAWYMPITAESPEGAARQALGIHRDPESIATVFSVQRQGKRWCVDLNNDGTVNKVTFEGEGFPDPDDEHPHDHGDYSDVN